MPLQRASVLSCEEHHPRRLRVFDYSERSLQRDFQAHCASKTHWAQRDRSPIAEGRLVGNRSRGIALALR